MGAIGQLYEQMDTNPGNQDWNGLVAACLVRKGLVPAWFTGEDYKNLTDTGTASVITPTASTGTDGVIQVTLAPEPVIVLPGGVPMDDPEALACTIVPLQ